LIKDLCVRDEKVQKEEKRKSENKITVDNKHYYLHKIIWLDIVGNSTLESAEEFLKMKPAEIITYAFIFKKDKNNLYTFSSYSLDGSFGDRNVIPLGVVKDYFQLS
jgi:hypothetical protein